MQRLSYFLIAIIATFFLSKAVIASFNELIPQNNSEKESSNLSQQR